MELANIEKLLEAYFKGETTLDEEKGLRKYFTKEDVPSHLLQYKSIFLAFEVAQGERTQNNFALPKSEQMSKKNWMYMVAAILVLAFLVGGIYKAQPKYSPEEREALAALQKTKEVMLLLSQNLNKGTEQLTFVNQFDQTKDRIFE